MNGSDWDSDKTGADPAYFETNTVKMGQGNRVREDELYTDKINEGVYLSRSGLECSPESIKI